MSGSGNNGEVMRAKVYRVLVFQQTAHRWEFVAHVELEELVGLLLVMSDVVFVVLVQFHLQSIFIVDELIAEVVVEVAVGGQQVDGCEVVFADVFLDGCFLLRIVGSAVDDDTLAGFIADHIAVLLKHVAYETLDGKHWRG